MFKNVASQSVSLLVIDTATNVPKTGDSANLTLYVKLDAGAVTALTNTPTEDSATNAPGIYTVSLTQAETNGDKITFSGKSSTSGVRVVPLFIQTIPFGIATSTNVTSAQSTITALLPDALVNGSIKAYVTQMASNTINATALDTTTGASDFGAELYTSLATAGIATAAGVTSARNTITALLPAALVSGRMDVSVGAYQTGLTPLQPTVSGRTLDVSAGGEAGIDLANVGSPTTTLNLSGTTISTSQAVASVSGSVGSVTGSVGGNVTGSVGSISGVTFPSGFSTLTVAAIADGVWDETTSGHSTAGTTGAAIIAAGSAGDPWSTSLPGAYGVGTAGKILGDNLNATITSRMASYTQPTGFLAATFPTTVASTTNITTVGAVSGAVGSVTSAVTVGTINAGVITASAIAADAITDAKVASDVTIASVTGSVGSVTGNVGGNVTGSVGSVVGAVGSVTSGVTVTTNNDKTGYSLATAPPTAAAIADAVWDEAISGHSTAGTTGAEIGAATDRVSYCLAILAGAISDAGTAAETYTITIGGNTFTADYTGLDATGNRTATTLSKT